MSSPLDGTQIPPDYRGSSRVELRRRAVLLDGRPFLALSGEIQPFRLDYGDWRDRLEKAAAMGLNSVGVYVPWNFHSQARGQCDFESPAREIGRFLDIANELGLKVIIRPGPYICNEWDLGGCPGWMLNEGPDDWRTSDPRHVELCLEWFHEINRILAPRQHDSGGPIILYQIENEHWQGDAPFFNALASAARRDGITLPFISNGGGSAAFSGAACVLDGCDIYTSLFEQWRWRGYVDLAGRLAGDAPLMVIEYAAALFVTWGAPPADPSRTNDYRDWLLTLSRAFLGLGAGLINQFVAVAGVTPITHSSDHVTTAYYEDAAVTHWGGLSPKFYAFRLLAEPVQSFNEILAEALPQRDLWATDNGRVEGLLRSGARGSFVTAINGTGTTEQFRIRLPDGRTLPRERPIQIPPRTSMFLPCGVELGLGWTLESSSVEVLRAWSQNGEVFVIFHGPSGSTQTACFLGSGVASVDFVCEDEVSHVCLEGPAPLHVFGASTSTAERTWLVRTESGAVPLFTNFDLVRPQADADGVLRAETSRPSNAWAAAWGARVECGPSLSEDGLRPDGLWAQRGSLPPACPPSVRLSEPEYAPVDYEWTLPAAPLGEEWIAVPSCSPGREVITSLGTYEYVLDFAVEPDEEIEFVEFLGICSAEAVVFLNGVKAGVFPEARPQNYHSLPDCRLCIPAAGLLRPGVNRLAFTLEVIGRHNTGRPIFAGISHPIVLGRERRERLLPEWEHSGFAGRRFPSSELAGPDMPDCLKNRIWEPVLLGESPLPQEADAADWLDIRAYRTRLAVPEDFAGRPMFLECPLLDDAWCFVNGRRAGRISNHMSACFDLSAFSNCGEIEVVIASRYYWGTRTALERPPVLTSFDRALPSTLLRRAGSGFTPPSGLEFGPDRPQAQAGWMRLGVKAGAQEGVSAPLYVELDEGWGSGSVIFWNGQPIGRHSDQGPEKRFAVPDRLVCPENEIAVYVSGHARLAAFGGLSVGSWLPSRQIQVRLSPLPAPAPLPR